MKEPSNNKKYSHNDMLDFLSYLYNTDNSTDVHEQVIECWLRNRAKNNE